MIISHISQPSPTRAISEDFLYRSKNRDHLTVAVGDWASNLVGGPYVYPPVCKLLDLPENTPLNGGVIGSQLAKDTIATSKVWGISLIEDINSRIRQAYKDLGIIDFEKNREFTFTGYIASVIADPIYTRITAVGDIFVAADGRVVAGKTKAIDIHNANLRADYIRETGDIAGSFNHIKPKIINQYSFQNNPGHEFTYPAIDGTKTLPLDQITVVSIPTPKQLLIWSDGYLTPEEFTIQGLENKLKTVYRRDRHRYTLFPAVKDSLDDRTALHIDFNDFETTQSFHIEPDPWLVELSRKMAHPTSFPSKKTR